MRNLLKHFSQTHGIRSAIEHWRLTIPMAVGAIAACLVWLLIPNQVLGTVVWILIAGSATGLGLIWDRHCPTGRMSGIEKLATDIKTQTEHLYVRHEYRQVDARHFRHLDLRFYEEVRDALVAQGCLWLGDVENVTLRGTGDDLSTFIRVLVSKDQTTCIGLYHPRSRFWLRLLLWIFRMRFGRTTDCETELSNGQYLVTSNAAEASRLTPPPGFDEKFFPVNTTHEVVFHAHRERLRGFLAAHPGTQATRMCTLLEVLEMQHRMQTAKAAHRKDIGHITEEELKRLGVNSGTAVAIKKAMNRSDHEV